MEWSNETISEFLILYENEPALWNSKSAEHKNRNDQYDAWVRIQSKLKDGTIPIKDIKKKRDTLMGTYRKLRSKISQSTKSGSGADDIYKPDWPFYNVMSTFLDDVYNPRKTKNSVDSEDTEEIEDHSDNSNDDTKQDDEGGQPQFKTPKILPKRTKKNETEKKMDEAYDYLKQMTQKLHTPQDECSLYTQLLCKKLRGLQENTSEIAMLEIDRLIFNLKQNEILTSNSYAQVSSVPINSSQPFNFGQSHQFPHFYDSATRNSHRQYSPQQVPSYNATPSPQQSPRYHPYPSPQQSTSYNSTPSPQPLPNDHPSPSPQQSTSYNSTPSPHPSPNYHPYPSLQQSTSYNSTPSPQPSPNDHSYPSSQQSTSYNSTPSPQPSPNDHPSPSPQQSTSYSLTPSLQPSPNDHPYPSPQQCTSYNSTPSPQPSPNDHPSASSQSSSKSHTSASPQLSQTEALLASNNVLKDFYEQEATNYA